jgi:hypothetical protein
MYRELVVEFNIKKDTTRQLEDALMKLKGQSGDMRALTNKLRKAENEISAIQGGLFNLVKYTDPKDFEAATRDLYRQFVKKEKGGRAPSKASKKRAPPAEEKKETVSADDSAGASSDGNGGAGGGGGGGVSMGDGAAKEAARQRDYMERTVHTLKKTLRLAGDRMQRKSKMSMDENTVLINECNMLRRENHRFRQRVAEMESSIRGLENKVRGPPGSRGGMGVGERVGSLLSQHSSRASVTGGGSRDGPHGSGWGNTTPSVDPRDMMASRGGMSPAVGSGRTDDAVQSGGSAVLAGIQEGSTSGGVQLPRPESQAQRMRREVSTASAGGSQRVSTTLRSVSTASLGGSGVHNRPGRSRGKIPGKVIRGSTRPIMEAATTRSKVQGMLNELDDNNRLIEMQRIEIGRLREQVQLMVNKDHMGGMMMDGIGMDGMRDSEIGPGGIVIVHTEGGVAGSRPGSRGIAAGGAGDNAGEIPPAFVMGQSQSQPHLEQRF